jgi:hypothetical protein
LPLTWDVRYLMKRADAGGTAAAAALVLEDMGFGQQPRA